MTAELELVSWRRAMAELFAAVRAEPDPEDGHRIWQSGRDELFRTHPQSPLPAGDPLRETGLPIWPYDASLRFDVELLPPDRSEELVVPTGGDDTTALQLIGHVHLPAPVEARIDVWWLHQYGGGIFIPLRDGTARDTSYGGGRYALDTAKGADLGGGPDRLVLDLNFLYHPSCRYSPDWVCPLAQAGNTISYPVRAGERL